ncbi:PDZ domain-containing protein 8 [Geranomyces variabilis]|uniref:PDZ domain-containing protein 8 n=1 Tax=Geranomyces variabilis TaxID=109894 RepID=A0AAD5XLL3_9FUNG|nr:PDZ domain-containing protein 8 [Geranomyces variabilis]
MNPNNHDPAHSLPLLAAASGISSSSFSAFFFRGLFFGILATIAVQAFIVYRIVSHLLDPNTRLTNPKKTAASDRPVYARDFVAVTGSRLGNPDADHEILNDDLLVDDKQTQPLASPVSPSAASRAHKLSREHNEPWPEHIIAFLKTALAPDYAVDTPAPPPRNKPQKTDAAASPAAAGSPATPSSSASPAHEAPVMLAPAEKCHWLNVFTTRFFLALRGSQMFKDKARAKWTGKINDKLKGNAWVSNVEIVDIEIGDCAPKIQAVRLIKAVTDDLAVSAELDITYDGGGSIAIQTTVVGGLKLPVRVHVSGFSGKLRVRCPSIQWADMIGVAFVDDPGATFRVDSPLTVRDNEMLRGMVNKLLSSVVRKVFLELWVLPSWRTFFMPLMEPKLEDVLARQNAAKETPAKKNIAAKAATLWETRSPLLRHSKNGTSALLGDIFAHAAFPTDVVLNAASPEVEDMDNKLVTAFLKYARELPTDATTIPLARAAHSNDELDSDRDSEQTAAQPQMVATQWKSVRNRSNIHIEKKRVLVDGEVAELTRGSMKMQCDAERVFSVLSNPEHDRHVDDSYVGSEIVYQFGMSLLLILGEIIDDARGIRNTKYKVGRQNHREFTAFFAKHRIGPKPVRAPRDPDSASLSSNGSFATTASGLDKPAEYVVVSRSIGAFSDNIETPGGAPNIVMSAPSVSLDTLASRDFTHSKEFSSGSHNGTSRSNGHLPVPDVVTASRDDDSIKGRPVSLASGDSASTSTAATKVFCFGYLITPDETTPAEACHVTILSQLSPDLSRIEVSYDSCRKLKAFIEELASLSGIAASRDRDSLGLGLHGLRTSGSSASLRKRRFFSDSSSAHSSSFGSQASGASSTLGAAEGRKMDKIKSFVGSTAGYLIKSRRVAGWLGKGNGGGGVSGSPMDDSMDEAGTSVFEADDERAESATLGGSEFGQATEQDAESGGSVGSEVHHPVNSGGGGDSSDHEGTLPSRPPTSNQGSSGRPASFHSLPELSFDSSSIMEEDVVEEEDSPKGEHLAPGRDPVRKIPSIPGPELPPRRPGSGKAAEENTSQVPPRPPPPTPADSHSHGTSSAAEFSSPTERTVAPRELVNVDLSFRRAAVSSSALLRWEYVIEGSDPQQTQNQSLLFSLAYVPEQGDTAAEVAGSASGAAFLSLFSAVPGPHGGRHLVPPMTIHAPHMRPARGCVPIPAVLPDGHFLFAFDNSAEKRVAKKVTLVTSIDQVIGRDGGGESALAVSKSIVSLDLAVPRKQIVRYPFAVDAAHPGAEVCWEFAVAGGYEIGFAVLFQPDMHDDEDDDDVGGRPRGGSIGSVSIGGGLVEEDGSSAHGHQREMSDASRSDVGGAESDAAETAERPRPASRASSNSALRDDAAAATSSETKQADTVSASTGSLVAAAASVSTAALTTRLPDSEMASIVDECSAAAAANTPPRPPSRPGSRGSGGRPSLSSRLAAAVTGKAQAAIAAQQARHSHHQSSQSPLGDLDRLTTPTSSSTRTPHAINPLQKVRGAGAGSVPAVKGVYYFVWDNSQAVVVGRRVDVRLWMR